MSTAAVTPRTAPGQDRPALQLVCAGVATLLTDAEIDLVDLVNDAEQVIESLLDLDADPDDYRLAEILVEHLCRRYGVERHADGDRITNVESALRRYLIPFLVETDATRPEGRRGVSALRITHLERLPRVLSGDLPVPAATVAGDLLGRRGAACVFLSLTDAAAVTDGGAPALDQAVAGGVVPLHRDARTGEDIVMPLDLRDAGLLIEPARPHGLKKSSARNILRDLELSIERARTHGANVRGTFKLAAIEPLVQNRARQPKMGQREVTLTETAALAADLSAIAQVALWVGRLVGNRIGEVFGLLVCDFFRDPEGRPWIDLSKQGGLACLVRDPETGRLVPQDRKPRTKTPKGIRCIPIPRPLGDLLDRLIEVFHTDPATGAVDYAARLLPGIGKDEASGQSTFRTALTEATEALGLATTPHDLRACLLTDLANAGIGERVRHFYAGHELENPTIQDRHYDRGVAPELLFEVTDLLEAKLAAELGTADLRVPTTATHRWGTQTTAHARRRHITEMLRSTGWLAAEHGAAGQGRELTVAEVARRVNLSVPRTRMMMRTGVIASHAKPWKTRSVWAAYEAGVEAYLATKAGVSIHDLAAEVGWNYHQTWYVLGQLELMPGDRHRGETVLLDEDTADTFRAEVSRRSKVEAGALRVCEAAEILDISVVSAETLIRQDFLEVTPGPTDTRDRWVTRASVEAYQAEFPVAAEATDEADDVAPLTCTKARRILGVSRHELTMLTTTRQLRLDHLPGSRHVYINTHSALAYAKRIAHARAIERLEDLIAAP